MFSCEINTIPHKKQRYDTVGDWIFDICNCQLSISVSKMNKWEYEALVAFHELVESLLCRKKGITSFAVDEWDMAHCNLDEPGEDPSAPYHDEHMFAEELEKLLAKRLGVNWDEYVQRIEELT